MLRYLLLLSATGLLIGCPPGDDDDAVGDDDDAVDVTPDAGTWDLTLTALNTDSCDGAPNAGPGDSLGTTEVVAAGDGTFTMTDSDNQTFDCTLDGGGDFSCVAQPMNIPLPVFPNATVTRNGTRSGTFTAAGVGALTNRNEDTCEGADCPVVEQAGGYTFPCVFDFDADAEAQ